MKHLGTHIRGMRAHESRGHPYSASVERHKPEYLTNKIYALLDVEFNAHMILHRRDRVSKSKRMNYNKISKHVYITQLKVVIRKGRHLCREELSRAPPIMFQAHQETLVFGRWLFLAAEGVSGFLVEWV